MNAPPTRLLNLLISLIMSCFLFLAPTSVLAMSVEKSNEIIRAFNDYVTELKQIEKNCKVKMNESDFFLLDSIQCSWRKEERLIENSGLAEIIYDLAYRRYAKKHDLAKEALLKISYHNSNQKILGEIKRFLVEKQELHNHTHKKQIQILQRYIENN